MKSKSNCQELLPRRHCHGNEHLNLSKARPSLRAREERQREKRNLFIGNKIFSRDDSKDDKHFFGNTPKPSVTFLQKLRGEGKILLKSKYINWLRLPMAKDHIGFNARCRIPAGQTMRANLMCMNISLHSWFMGINLPSG